MVKGRESSPTRRRWRAIIALLATLALVVAACGDSADTTTEPTEPAATAAPTTAAGPSGLEQAQAIVDAASARITEWIGPDSAPTPLEGVKIGVVNCAEFVEGCSRQSDGVDEAAAVLGWEVIRIGGQLDPTVMAEAVNSLVAQGVDAIILNSIFAGVIGDAVEGAVADGVPVITSFSGDPTPWGGLIEIKIDNFEAGRAAGAYIITQGGGNVAIFDHNENPEVAKRAEGLRAVIQELAPNDTGIVFDEFVPGAQIGPPLEELASAMLQANPEGTVQWVFGGFDAILTSVVRAVDRAGRDKIRGIAYDANLENLNFIREGIVQTAAIGYPLEWTGWALIDELNRHLQGEPINEPYIQYRLITADNLPPEGQTWQGDFDFRSKYMELWSVG